MYDGPLMSGSSAAIQAGGDERRAAAGMEVAKEWGSQWWAVSR